VGGGEERGRAALGGGSGGPGDFFLGGLSEIFGERRARRRHWVSLAVTGGGAALPRGFRGAEVTAVAPGAPILAGSQ